MSVVQNDHLTRLRAAELRARLNAGGLTLALAKNNIPVSADLALLDIAQADFAGYAPIVTGADAWGPPGKTDLGVWTIQSETYTWDCSSGAQVVYLWYLHDGVHVWLAERWEGGVLVSAVRPLVLQITLSVSGEPVSS